MPDELRFFDAHCHVQFEHYAADREELLAVMEERRVGGVIAGCDYASSKLAVELAEQHPHLYAAVGLHPNHEASEWFEVEKYRELAESPKVVSVGECGLDYYRPLEINEEVKEKQKATLREQIAFAAGLDLPLTIHARPKKGTQDAYVDLIEVLQEAKVALGKAVRGDVHFFVGGPDEAHALNALDFMVSFTGVITFARDYDASIRAVPLSMILAETDAPYVAPASRRGERNDPLAVEEVATKIAEVRGEDPERVRSALVANAKRLFGIA